MNPKMSDKKKTERIYIQMIREKITKRKVFAKNFFVGSCLFILVAIMIAFQLQEAYGVPYFSRKFNVDCNSCHITPPMLNQK